MGGAVIGKEIYTLYCLLYVFLTTDALWDLLWKNTALHLAARAGHVAAVRLLLSRGAQIFLNHSDASFLHEAIHNGRKDVTSAVIDSNRSVRAIPSCTAVRDKVLTKKAWPA